MEDVKELLLINCIILANRYVSILVLMEDVKEPSLLADCGGCILDVSILVLMEDVKELYKIEE